MAQSNPNDLDELIDAAARQVSKAEAASQSARNSAASSGGRKAGAVAITLGVMLVAWILWTRFAPPRPSQVEHDLDAAVELARQSVETARKNSGTLPPALPNASLAAVVGYEQEQDGYRLVASMMGIRVTLERDGTKKVEKRP